MQLGTVFLSFFDLAVTPIYLIVFLLALFLISGKIKSKTMRNYFFYGIMLKVTFSILFGVIYEFFYQGGDTSAYWLYGTYVGDSLWDSPIKWIKLILHVDSDPTIYEYTSKIRWYGIDGGSYFPCRVVGILAPFCFNIYSVIAIFYAAINFSGLWALFKTLCRAYPEQHRILAISIFFIPSIIFWGSGIMKDGITLSALGWLFYGFHNFFILRDYKFSNIVIIIVAAWVISIVKIYILLCFIPCASIWTFLLYESKIDNMTLRIILKPFIIALAIGVGILITYYTAQSSRFYSFENIGQTAKTTREYILFISNRSGGSSYDIGEFDQSISGIIRIFPAAINVSLFRPYIWESKNFFMLMSAIESSLFLYLAVSLLISAGPRRILAELRQNHFMAFCLLFSLTFALAIGISTNNFGTLTRYKIPLIPFMLFFLLMMRDKLITKRKKRQVS